VFRGQIACHADGDGLLREIESQGAVQDIPPAENLTVSSDIQFRNNIPAPMVRPT